uniref:Uncharacterized protein n=1 Tax=Oryzias melastigma TaxID=30732 RepID=A0A3B3BS35_ORYME
LSGLRTGTMSPWLGDDSQNGDYRSRWRSIRVMYFTMFLSSVGEFIHAFFKTIQVSTKMSM